MTVAMETQKFNLSTERGIQDWILWHYRNEGFSSNGDFKGFDWLKGHLCAQVPEKQGLAVRQTVNSFVKAHRFPKPYLITKSIKEKAGPHVETTKSEVTKTGSGKLETFLSTPTPVSVPNGYASDSKTSPTNITTSTLATNGCKDHLLIRKLDQLHLSNKLDVGYGSQALCEDAASKLDYSAMSLLLPGDSDDDSNDEIEDRLTHKMSNEIKHAPLFDQAMLVDKTRELLPQYGIIGLHNTRYARSKLFLNTNIPFSAFICGVQGSGKSHTTSCIMENALISSNNLGQLQKPLSALVFSYGHFSGDGSGYTISEAAFLAVPHPDMPNGRCVKKVNVLVSPSNYVRISKLYTCIPNVTVAPFKLKSKNLDIDIMLTLMNVNESDETPLYMAQVQNILRQMATTDIAFDYKFFKNQLQKEDFNPAQKNMLQLRLNLLESFLDLDDTCPEATFEPGEITIMDMSCPFVDSNTACILFRIALQRYLQSGTSGKMIVLDEAHKYMIKVPGAKALNETLLQTIRLQRHYGARIVVSTQEPTLLTDLIALCSITFIHRFSSPEWFAAIKRHIPMGTQDREDLMQRIEGLKTGVALAYSPNAVLGWDNEDNLVKGTGKMIKISVRKRITSDGGQSILAV